MTSYSIQPVGGPWSFSSQEPTKKRSLPEEEEGPSKRIKGMTVHIKWRDSVEENLLTRLQEPGYEVTEFVSEKDSAVTSPLLDQLTLHGKRLQKLQLDDVDSTLNGSLKVVIKTCKRLLEVKFKINGEENDTLLEDLPGGNFALSLNLSFNQKTTDKGIETILDKYPNLQSLDLSCSLNLTGKTLQLLAEKATSLVHLKVRGCDSFAKETIQQTLGNSCFSLKSLDLGCNRWADPTIIAIVKRHRELTSLILDGCKIGDEALEAIGINCPTIEKLNLTMSPEITNQGVSALAQRCKELTNLNLASCYGIDEKAIEILAKNCSKIKILNLCSLTEDVFTMEALKYLADYFPSLEELCLSRTELASHQILKRIVSKHHNLQHLWIENVWKLSKEEVKEIQLIKADVEIHSQYDRT